ncbi:DinB family protein [Kibdelosporangium persicum]|uniref:DinB family protein n=1 Tax=Kibdelosporangium persicum TaxID=2698649 RepID=UPI0028AA7177|nr:DinB family protein [Kibdelosporangium persicum]
MDTSPTITTPVSAGEYLYFLDRAFRGMLEVLAELGDDRVNTRPPLGGANSPYAIAYHCAEVADYWIGHVVAGRPSTRDRNAEFGATGSIETLREHIANVRRNLRDDLAAEVPLYPANPPSADYEGPDRPLTSTGVLLHVLEELAQHHGQVQLTRDVLLGKQAS